MYARSTPLVGPCPAPVRIGQTTRDGTTTTRSISAADGGRASVTVPAIRVDTQKPKLTISGVRNGATYTRPHMPSCRASDTLSGLAGTWCRITSRKVRQRHATVVTYKASATDLAGNTTTRRGTYRILR